MIDKKFSLFSRCLGTFIPSLIPDQFDYLSTELTPSESEPCHCCSCFVRRRKERKKFTVRRMPGKIAHLVPMQRLDSVTTKRNFLTTKPSNPDHQLPTTTTTSNFETKKSFEDPSITTRSSPPQLTLSFPPLVHPSTSIHSLKPSYDQNKSSNKSTENTLSPSRIQEVLSRFRQDAELIPIRFDASIKRSSV